MGQVKLWGPAWVDCVSSTSLQPVKTKQSALHDSWDRYDLAVPVVNVAQPELSELDMVDEPQTPPFVCSWQIQLESTA